MTKKNNAIVIGAGIGGIAIAIRLKAKGFNVTVIEKNEVPGGKMDEIYWNGFRWDTGPSLFTLPHLVEELFELFNRKTSEEFKYQKLHVVCRYFFPDGLIINAHNSPEKFSEEIENKTGVSRGTILQYLKRSEIIYKLTSPVFIFDTFHKFNWKRIKKGIYALFNFHKLQAFQTMHNANKKFLKDSRIIQLFDRFATYNGSNPYKAPATLNVIPYLEHCLGAYFPQKGMYSIVEALVGLAKTEGVIFNTDEEVIKIEHANRQIKSVVTNKSKYEGAVVVSDSDIVPLYKLFEPEVKLARRFTRYQRSSSALIFYWAINKSFHQLDLHNIFFSKNYTEEFDHLFNKKTAYHDPTIYLFISSKQVISDAPKDKENWFVMINAPENVDRDRNRFIDMNRKTIIKKLSKILNTDIEKLILHEETLDPYKIEQKTGSFKGSLYGASSNSKWSAFQRHANFSGKIKGMYFVGGSVHPGGGIPLCLSSAKIVSSILKE